MFLGKRNHCALQTYGGNTLKRISEPVTAFNRELAELADTMIKVMHHLEGIGLAGVQIGVLKRIIVLDIAQSSMGEPPTPGELELLPRMPLALVNPKIVEYGKEMLPYDEGCLSVPALFAEVIRPRTIRVQAQDLNGAAMEFEAGGLLARCIQHECDHLDGKLFVDRVTPEVFATIEDQLKLMERRGRKNNFHRDLNV